jgi:glucose/arabinose dehydrogenase
MFRRSTLLALAALSLLAPASADALTLTPVGSYAAPVYVGSIPTDANRLLVVEQAGRIMETTGGATTTYLDIRPLVATGSLQGLLSFAFPPDYATSHLIYVAYTRKSDGALEVDRFAADAAAADPSTRRQVIVVPHEGPTSHYGGQLQFGPDGYLYVSTGDGGGGSDPSAPAAQNLGVLLGKLLRIDPRPSGGRPYTVPANNPFVGISEARPEIWAYGFRNPWRFSFDRLTGALAVGDVGQSAWEEVDYEPQPHPGRGDNFGWDCREGTHPYPFPSPSCTGVTDFTDPVFEYNHSGGRCAIIGGYVMRDPGIPALLGRYVYADLCVGDLRSVTLPGARDDRSEGVSVSQPTSFGEDACGRIYIASQAGEVDRLTGPAPTPCPAVAPVAPTTTAVTCSPSTVLDTGATTCTATVSSSAGASVGAPTGSVGFSSTDPRGSFDPTACTLSASGPTASSCQASYSPSPLVGGVGISGRYGGASGFLPSDGSTSIKVRAANHFSQGKLVHNRRRGTARLALTVRAPGVLLAHGRYVRSFRRLAPAAGTFTVRIAAKGKRLRRLHRTGKAKVIAKLSYTPTGGQRRTRTRTVRLRFKR